MELSPREKVENAICTNVSEDEAEELMNKGYEMVELCKEKDGVGLAGPQVGIYKNLIVLRELHTPRFEVIFNPAFYRDGGKTRTIEGCLTYPDEYYYLRRFKRVGVVYYLWNGSEFIKKTKKVQAMEAFMWQHECNHLGVGCKNRMGTTIAMIGELVEEDKIKKKTSSSGEEFKIPKL